MEVHKLCDVSIKGIRHRIGSSRDPQAAGFFVAERMEPADFDTKINGEMI
ncbi:MAG: hypothetical protein Q4A75_01775 [Peptostreptococcaceae bacterium]|nr:hypothetical protein [Peptostreptococcaceae bacterium]